MSHVLPFERPIADLMRRVRDLRTLVASDPRLSPELARLEQNAEHLTRQLFAALSPMQRVQLSRHPDRPYTLDYLPRLIAGFVELHGDRRYADDAAIVGGLGRYHGRGVVVVGHQKGRTTRDNVVRRFGMPNPEGYRKAERLYRLAERFSLPLLTFIDTPGAYPGIEGEERGQSEAIATCLETLAGLTVPVLAVVLGEGGSGGALALGVANRVLMLEHAYYSVISPEGCASILWKDGGRAPEAAELLKLTAPDLLALGAIDRIVQEPAGGAHHDPESAAARLDAALHETLLSLDGLTPAALREDRYRRFRALGATTG